MIEIKDQKHLVRQKPDPRALAVYPFSCNRFFALLADLLQARNPWIERPCPVGPLAPEDLINNKGNEPLPMEAVYRALHSISLDPHIWTMDAIYRADPDKPATDTSKLPTMQEIQKTPVALIQAIRVITTQGRLPMQRRRLMKDDRIVTLLEMFKARANTPETFTMDMIAQGLSKGGLTDGSVCAEAALFNILATLTTAGTVLESNYFANVARIENSEKHEVSIENTNQKALRTACYLGWNSTRYLDFVLRPFIWYILEPRNMVRITRRAYPDQIAKFTKNAATIMDRPTLPWLAEALRYMAPSSRQSAIGNGPSMGFWSHMMGVAATWAKFEVGPVTVGADTVEHLNPLTLFQKLAPVLEEFAELIELWSRAADLPSLEAAVNAQRIGTPVNINLWGPMTSPTHVAPTTASSNVSNALELLTSFLLPGALNDPGSTIFRYTERDERSTLLIGGQEVAEDKRLLAPVVISVEPEDRQFYIGADLTGVIPPQHLQWAYPPHYSGESDAVVLRATEGALAAFLSITRQELVAEIKAHAAAWSHLVNYDSAAPIDQQLTWLVPTTPSGVTSLPLIVYSHVTQREPWHRLVDLPRMAPGQYVIVVEGRPEGRLPVAIKYAWDLAPVELPISMDAVRDQLIAIAQGPFR